MTTDEIEETAREAAYWFEGNDCGAAGPVHAESWIAGAFRSSGAPTGSWPHWRAAFDAELARRSAP